MSCDIALQQTRRRDTVWHRHKGVVIELINAMQLFPHQILRKMSLLFGLHGPKINEDIITIIEGETLSNEPKTSIRSVNKCSFVEPFVIGKTSISNALEPTAMN